MATPSGQNTFLLSWEASGKMVAGYSKNVDKFTVNRVAQFVPTEVTSGVYQEYDSSQAVRVDLNRFVWDDNSPAPTGQDNLAGWNNKPFLTQRFAPTFTVGQLAVSQADWDLVARCAAQAGSQAMTWRTIQYLTSLKNASWGTHAVAVQTGTAGSPVAGSTPDANVDWASGTSSNPVIQKALLAAALMINRDTLDTVGVSDLKLLTVARDGRGDRQHGRGPRLRRPVAVRPGAAEGGRAEPERHLGPPLAPLWVRGPGRGRGPGVVRGPQPVVDERRGRPHLPDQRLLPDQPGGGLEGIPGAPSFSTVVGFVQEDMTVETKYDSDNRYTWGRVVQNLCFVVPSVASGVAFTGCFASKLPTS